MSAGGDIYIEIIPLDKGLRIVAVDADTGTEVVFAAPSNCSRARIDELAKAKLQRRLSLEKQRKSGAHGQETELKNGRSTTKNERRGRLV